MIRFLRHKTIQRTLFIGLAILVIPGFVFLSVSKDSSALSGTAGTIDGQKVKVQEFVRNFEAMRRELEVFAGVDPTRLSGSVDLEALTWQRILLVRAAKTAGIHVTDADVIQWLQNQKVFQDKGGFSEERYRMIIERYLKIDPKTFEEESREYLALQRYRDQIRGTYHPTEAELHDRFRLLYGPRELEYVTFTKDNVAAPAPSTETERKAMYDRLAGRLFSQESAEVRYVAISSGDPSPTAEAEKALWESNATRTPFLAKEDPIPGIGPAPKLSEAIFQLKTAGARTDWIDSEGKKYRFELIEHKAQAPMSYEDAKKVLDEMVRQEKIYHEIAKKASDFEEAVKKMGWPQAVAAEKLELQTVASYVPGHSIKKIGKLQNAGAGLSEVKVGEVSNLIPISSGVAVFKVVSQAAPDEKLFAKKRASIEKDLRLRHEMIVFGQALKKLESTLTINSPTLAKLFPAKYAESPTPTK